MSSSFVRLTEATSKKSEQISIRKQKNKKMYCKILLIS